MARSLVEQLPPPVREWLEGELVRAGFGGYSELTEQLNGKLAETGLEIRVSRSSLHRYGSKVADRIDAIRRSTEIARTLAREVGDDEGAMSDALTRLVQERLFELTMEMQVDPDDVDIYKLGKTVAELGRASVAQKRFVADYREKVGKKLDALEAQASGDGAAKAGGKLDPDTLRRVREEIYGIFS